MVDSDEVDGGTVVGYDGEGRVVSIEVLGLFEEGLQPQRAYREGARRPRESLRVALTFHAPELMKRGLAEARS